MGWVTLTLRKKELQRTHSDLQMEDLQISRQSRQMARQYNYEQTVVQNDQQDALSDRRQAYKSDTTSIYDQISEKRKELNNGNLTDQEKTDINNQIEELNKDVRQAQEDYNYETNEIKTMYEKDLEMIEEEANDIETMYENEKVQIEAQMEAVASELEAVKEAVSQEIQNSTISLK